MTASISPSAATQVTTDQPSTIPDQAQIASEFGGDAAAQLAAMVFLFSRERSKNSAQQRDQIEGQIRQCESAQVQKLHQSADAAYNATLWKAGGQLAAGAFSAVGSAATASGQDWGNIVSAGGDLTQGGMNFIAADDELKASNRAADAEHAGNQAASYERSLESVNSSADDAKSMKDAVYDFLQGIQDTRAESDKALVSIRA